MLSETDISVFGGVVILFAIWNRGFWSLLSPWKVALVLVPDRCLVGCTGPTAMYIQILEPLQKLDGDDRTIHWEDIFDKPVYRPHAKQYQQSWFVHDTEAGAWEGRLGGQIPWISLECVHGCLMQPQETCSEWDEYSRAISLFRKIFGPCSGHRQYQKQQLTGFTHETRL